MYPSKAQSGNILITALILCLIGSIMVSALLTQVIIQIRIVDNFTRGQNESIIYDE